MLYANLRLASSDLAIHIWIMYILRAFESTPSLQIFEVLSNAVANGTGTAQRCGCAHMFKRFGQPHILYQLVLPLVSRLSLIHI